MIASLKSRAASRKATRKPHWRQLGTEPDYRFSLANERTFLAWIRTALSILAGSVFLDQFSTKLASQHAGLLISVALGFLAAALCGIAYRRWRSNEIAMRHARELPGTIIISVLAGFMLVISAVITILLAL
ncbi:MAG: DUF202 domain-containing protein [Rhizobiales bacterium]|nr:DUF202 domain-containing protein [Hyphomicrobiales bacterium]